MTVFSQINGSVNYSKVLKFQLHLLPNTGDTE